MRRAVTVALLLLGSIVGVAAVPAGASAATTTAPALSEVNPLSLGVPQASTTATTPTVPPSSTASTATDSGFGTVDWVVIVAGIAVVIVGIVVFVMRDSRQTARGLGLNPSAATGMPAGAHAGSKTPTRSRKLSAQEKRRRKRGRAPRRR